MASALSRVFASGMQAAMWGLLQVDRYRNSLIFDVNGVESSQAMIRKLQSAGDIHRSYMVNGWVVVSHEDVKALLLDKRLSTAVFDNSLIRMLIRSAADGMVVPIVDYPTMLHTDQPDHTRLRKLSAQGFTNRFVQSLAPKIDQIVTDLLAAAGNEPAIDVMEVLAKPLPAIVIAEMLGVPVSDRHLFEAWSTRLLGYTEVFDPDAMRGAVEGDLAMRVYLQELTEEKRAAPGDDLISVLLAAEEAGEHLDMDELLSLCTLLLVAGHETTTRLIGNCLSLLLDHPDQFTEVREDRSLVSAAIEESLRLEPPVMAVSRQVATAFDYKGHRFRKGQMLLLSIAGANGDARVTPEPGAFNIHRPAFDHVSFGHGIHLCLGMPLARLEADIALNRLLDTYAEISPGDRPPAWQDSPFFHGLDQLDIRVAPA